jgi:hypothetical protein
MIYVVEIQGPSGGKATKEYEASSMRGALRFVELDLRPHPQFQITDIRLGAEWNVLVSGEEW